MMSIHVCFGWMLRMRDLRLQSPMLIEGIVLNLALRQPCLYVCMCVHMSGTG
jgi:hypothetical protein